MGAREGRLGGWRPRRSVRSRILLWVIVMAALGLGDTTGPEEGTAKVQARSPVQAVPGSTIRAASAPCRG